MHLAIQFPVFQKGFDHAARIPRCSRSWGMPEADLGATHFSTRPLMTAQSIDEVRAAVATARRRGARVGCVPTMGALHRGHLSLIETARERCDFVVVTIFVNPTQFGPNEDYERYPRPLDDDLDACREAGVDLVFHPAPETMYPPNDSTFVELAGLSDVLEGAHRPGHFRGVATVVVKLLNIVGADISFFGQKDFQQQLLIRRMCADLFIPGEIATCPTVREPDGLALSSRNAYLTPEQRQSALALSRSLILARDLLTSGEVNVAAVREAMHAHLNAAPGVEVDYATIADPETLEETAVPLTEMVALVAARVGTTRLIDNMLIHL